MPSLKKLLFPVIFGLSLTTYSTYAVLDTFVIEQEMGEVSFNENLFNDTTEPISLPEPNTTENNTVSTSASSNITDIVSESNITEEKTTNQVTENITTESSIVEPQTPYVIDNYFMSEPVLTEKSYIDRNIAINISDEVIQVKNKDGKMVDTKVYTADIRLRSMKYFRTCLAQDKYGQKIVEKTSCMAERCNAIFAFNGDYYGAQEKGYVVRNGTVFRSVRKSSKIDKSDLAIYTDGSFEYFYEKPNPLDTIVNKKIGDNISCYQVFAFGPQLVSDSTRSVSESDEVAVFSTLGNQRCAIGYVENLHYIVCICDGRLKDSWGMELYQMADYMITKGCKSAYNLDGGGSATFWFNGEVINRPNTNGDKDIKEREISDCVYITAG